MRKNWKNRLRYYLQYIPFTVNTGIFAVAGVSCYLLLRRGPRVKGEADTDSFAGLVFIMGRLLLFFLAGLVCLSIASALFTWLLYLIRRRSAGRGLQVDFDAGQKGRKTRLQVHARIKGALRPLLGFVKCRLFYDDFQMTDRFALLSSEAREHSILRQAIASTSNLMLPDVREYRLHGGFVYFEDMLQLISLPSRERLSGNFYKPPVLGAARETELLPQRTDSPDVRIEQMRRVEGDPLSYKDFEPGDDVRRIVWKVYARNRELVVRIPERFEPYASHIYFYASFDSTGAGDGTRSDYAREMLNFYKSRVWTIYESISKQEWEVRYVPDQQLQLPETASPKDQVMRTITASAWMPGILEGYVPASKSSVLCISSFTDISALQTLLEQSGPDTIVYFIRLSDTFRHFAPLGWIGQLLFRSPQDRLRRIRRSWLFTPLRRRVKANERAITALLRDAQVGIGQLVSK